MHETLWLTYGPVLHCRSRIFGWCMACAAANHPFPVSCGKIRTLLGQLTGNLCGLAEPFRISESACHHATLGCCNG